MSDPKYQGYTNADNYQPTQPPSGFTHPPDNLVYAPQSGQYSVPPSYAPQNTYTQPGPYQPPPYSGAQPAYAQPPYNPSYGTAPTPYGATPAPGYQPGYGTVPANVPPPYSSPPPQTGEKFPEKSGYRDLLFYILFVAHVAVLFLLLALSAKASSNTSTSSTNSTGTPTNSTSDDISASEVADVIGVCAMCAAVACVVAGAWLVIMRQFAEQLIYFTMIMSVVVCLGVAVLFFAMGQIVLGILFLLSGLLNMLFFYWWRSRIPFAREMLKCISYVTQRFPAPIYVAFVATLVMVGWVVLWMVVAGLVQKNFSSGAAAGATIWLIFSFYWTTQVIKNVIHVTNSGLFATWYFMEGTVGMPRNPTLKSLKRAVTTSFGSICFGSLLVALLQTLRTLISGLKNQKNAILVMIVDCILGCIENLLQYFNFYAYTQVAIYGKTFCEAAKATWDLLHTHGFEAIVNDNLISGVLLMGCILGGAITALVGGVLGHIIIDRYWVLLAVVGFFIGFSIMLLVMEVVESGVATIFVCFAEDSEALRRNNPGLYEKFRSTYGHCCTWLV